MSDELVSQPTPRPIASPQLALSESAETTVWDTHYPPANRIDDPDTLDDWLELADQSLADSRNGVTAISWPLAMAALLALLLLIADAVEGVAVTKLANADGWTALVVANPGRAAIAVLLSILAAIAFMVANEGTQARKTLTQIRASYLRRRREMQAGPIADCPRAQE